MRLTLLPLQDLVRPVAECLETHGLIQTLKRITRLRQLHITIAQIEKISAATPSLPLHQTRQRESSIQPKHKQFRGVQTYPVGSDMRSPGCKRSRRQSGDQSTMTASSGALRSAPWPCASLARRTPFPMYKRTEYVSAKLAVWPGEIADQHLPHQARQATAERWLRTP